MSIRVSSALAGSRGCRSSRCSHSARVPRAVGAAGTLGAAIVRGQGSATGTLRGKVPPAEVPLSGQLPYSPESYALGNIK